MSGRDLLVRAVPVDLFDWVDSRARTTNFTKRELVITALKRMRDDEMYERYPLFEGLVDEQVHVDSFPFKFIDLFAGIGGFHVALHNLGVKCVASCEIDKYARQTYEHNFKKISPDLFSSDQFYDDIEQIIPTELPEYDILCAGFPCQPFSQAGYKKGFQEDKDNRGNMFFEVLRLLTENKPRAFCSLSIE